MVQDNFVRAVRLVKIACAFSHPHKRIFPALFNRVPVTRRLPDFLDGADVRGGVRTAQIGIYAVLRIDRKGLDLTA